MRLASVSLMFSMFLLLASHGRAQDIDLHLTEAYRVLGSPIFLTHAGDGSGRVFIVRQSGDILIGINGEVLQTPFLDMGGLVSGDEEQGLLGLAFAPDFASSGRFYVNYTNPSGGTDIARYRVSATDPNRADPASRRVLLAYPQPFANHNGGWLGFGPDGYLYIASGDGGSGGDPMNNAQRLDTRLGKMLRIDVSGENAIAPPGNPFVSSAGAAPEIWAYGLRNPWRASFDRLTGDLWIADVGQGRIEEVNFQPAGSGGGQNYGWRNLEGSQCSSASGCSSAGTVLPVDEYGHDLGCSVTGGYVYRGNLYPDLQGTYLFGDFCSGRVFGLRSNGNGGWTRTQLASSGRLIASFGEDESGNVYLVGHDGVILLLSDGVPVAGPMIDRQFSGTWFDPDLSGQGLFIEVLSDTQLVAYWFTFDPAGQQAWFGGVGSIQGNRATVQATRVLGGRFLPNFDPAAITIGAFGTLQLSFDSCREGRVVYTLPDGFGSGEMRLSRLTVPLGNDCGSVSRH